MKELDNFPVGTPSPGQIKKFLTETSQKQGMTAEEFAASFSQALTYLSLPTDSVASGLKASKGTITKWTTGQAAPHSTARAGIFAALLLLVN